MTLTLLGPNSSDVTATAAAKMKPELRPISAVLTLSAASLSDTASNVNATGVGKSPMASHPVLAK